MTCKQSTMRSFPEWLTTPLILLICVAIVAGAWPPNISYAQYDDDEDAAVKTSESQDKTSFITIDFGASFNPRRRHLQFVEVTIEDDRVPMISLADRDRRLRERFPEMVLGIIAGLEASLEEGQMSFYMGDYERAANRIENTFDGINENLRALAIKEEFAELAWNAGLSLILSLQGPENDYRRDRALASLVKLFPSRTPDEMRFPPSVVGLYEKVFRPALENGFELSIRVEKDCYATLNGTRVEYTDHKKRQADIPVLPGKYAIMQRCTDPKKDRLFIVPVFQDEFVDFDGDLARSFKFPDKFDIDVRNAIKDDNAEAKLTNVIVTLGRRLQVDDMIAVGLVPPPEGAPAESESQYKMYLVDVNEGEKVRSLSVPLSQIPTQERMNEALDSLMTGREFEIIGPPPPEETDWTLIGIITSSVGGAVLIGGVVLAFLSQDQNDQFITCNQDPSCRSDVATQQDLIQTRDQYALIGNIMMISGGVIVAAGLTMILVHQLTRDDEIEAEDFEGGDDIEDRFEDDEFDYDASRNMQFGIAPTGDGGMIQFGLIF